MAQKINSSATSYGLLGSLAFFLLSFLILFHSKTTAQEKAGANKPAQEVRVLELGKPIERQLAGGEVHVYQIKTKKGHYLHVIFDQRGIDVVVTAFGPDGKQIAEFDIRKRGPEPVSLLAEVSGIYRLEVRRHKKAAPVGRYETRIVALHQPTPEDRTRMAAEQDAAAAKHLLTQKTTESKRKAIEKYEEALQLWRVMRDSMQVAYTLGSIGIAYKDDIEDKQKALDYLQQALRLWQSIGNQSEEAYTLVSIGAVYNNLYDGKQALVYLDQALSFLQTEEDRGGKAAALGNLSVAYDNLGEKQKALEYISEALPIVQALGDKERESQFLLYAGSLYFNLNQPKQAIPYLEKAIPLAQEAGDIGTKARSLFLLGGSYFFLGQYQSALDHLNQALPLWRQVGDCVMETQTHITLGGCYQIIGDTTKTREQFKLAKQLQQSECKTLSEEPQQQKMRIAAMNAQFKGQELYLKGTPEAKQEAIEKYKEALGLWRALQERQSETITLVSIGAIYSELDEGKSALTYLNEALLRCQSAGDRIGEAFVLTGLGENFRKMGEQEKAINYLTKGRELSQVEGTRVIEGIALYNLAQIECDRGNLITARAQMETSLDLAESIRTEISNDMLRASSLASIYECYEFYIDLLMRLYQRSPSKENAASALQASERARARSLLEILAEAQAEIRQGIDPNLRERERTLQQQINANEQNRMKLLSIPHTEKQVSAIKNDVEALLAQFQEIQAQIRANSPRYAALTQPQPLNLKEIQKRVLDNNTVLLEYALGEEHSYLWAITKNQCSIFTLPPRKEIEESVKGYLAIINSPSSPALYITSQGKSLYDALLKPAGKILQTKPNLIIVPDGILHYLPFEALVDSVKNNAPRHLIESINISYAPSASVLGLIKNQKRTPTQKNSRELLALGDPIFGDETATAKRDAIAPDTASVDTSAVEMTERGLYEERGYKFNRLPHTAKEIEKIAAHLPVDKKMTYLRAEAKEERVKADKLSQYRILHFATHGVLDEQTPGRSSVVLTLDNDPTEDGFLQMNEIFNLNLDADLVVLSACQTGKGKLLRGEGVIGMTRAFMYAGARSLVVSLWPVNDQSTVELMAKFYDYMQQGKAKNAALRQAKLNLIKGNNPALRHPYFWAPFVLMGENK